MFLSHGAGGSATDFDGAPSRQPTRKRAAPHTEQGDGHPEQRGLGADRAARRLDPIFALAPSHIGRPDRGGRR